MLIQGLISPMGAGEAKMIRGLYTSATGMLTQRKKMNVLVNNIVNADTTGYKSDKLLSQSFQQLLVQRKDGGAAGFGMVGTMTLGTHIDEIFTTFGQGPMDQTNLTTDLAITGDGFFQVNTPGGIRYTRDGNFTVNGGYLVTAQGYTVTGNNGPIQVADANFIVTTNGQVLVGDQVIDRLSVVRFDDPAVLTKEGDSYFSAAGGGQVDENSMIQQGYLEGSDVNLSDAMVDMIKVSRLYETNQRMVTAVDDSLAKAVTEIGSV